MRQRGIKQDRFSLANASGYLLCGSDLRRFMQNVLTRRVIGSDEHLESQY
jgi:hypothetical protein